MFKLVTGKKVYTGDNYKKLFNDAGLRIPTESDGFEFDKIKLLTVDPVQRKFAEKVDTNYLVLYSLQEFN